jgi:starch-binding outer membrane protein, SusD/RagB family
MTHQGICVRVPRTLGRATGLALALFAAAAVAGCSGLLDVENPNNVDESSLSNPQSADQQATGIQASLGGMLATMMVPYATATDELDWIGSRDGWRELDRGTLSNISNEFIDAAFPFVGEARYLADKTVARLEEFDAAATLPSRASLARAYLYAAVIYGSIADMWDDFAFSDKMSAAPAVGRANMGQLYDKGISYLDKGLAIATALPVTTDNTTLRYNILATRARLKHGKAVWSRITPEGTVPTNPLVNDAGAVADANAALALLPGADDRFRVRATAEANVRGPGLHLFNEVSGRQEMRLGNAYTGLRDPISGEVDATATALVAEFRAYGTQTGFFTLASDRELRLILAEAALARGDLPAFTSEINAVRAVHNKPAYAGQIPALDMLKHERRAHLFLQLRRLADLYRFGERAGQWVADPNFKSAASTPGLLFYVPIIERRANPCIENPSACSG